MKKILFVCTGNTCRSSMAEAIGRDEIKKRAMEKEIEVSSAGIYAMPGDKASPNAVEAMKDMKIDISFHKARRINHDLIEESYIILTMTESHKRELINISPASREKAFTLKEYADGIKGDIKDPFGQSIETYRECSIELREYIRLVIEKIIAV